MNYIKKLEQNKQELIDELEQLKEQIAELRQYLLSEKFQSEQNALYGYVNVKDILNRLEN